MSTKDAVANFEADKLLGQIKRAKVVKAAAEVLIVAACIFWVGWWFVSPDPEGDAKYVETWIGLKSKSRFFRTDGREGKTPDANLGLVFTSCPGARGTAI